MIKTNLTNNFQPDKRRQFKARGISWLIVYLKDQYDLANSIFTAIIVLIQWIACIFATISVACNWCILELSGKTLEYTTVVCKKNLRRRVIPDRIDNGDYLERYYLLLKDRKTFPFNIFVHKFLKSDPDDVHNHPWDFAHLIIRGGYWETVASNDNPIITTRYWRSAGYFNFAKSNHIHKVELDPTKPYPITLFVPFSQKTWETWGFFVRQAGVGGDPPNVIAKFMPHNEYFDMKKKA